MKTSYQNKKAQGFSLTELMITVVILGIVLSIGLPSLQDFTSGARITASVNALAGALQLARSEAIKQIKNAGIVPITAQKTVSPAWGDTATTSFLVFVDKNGNSAYDAGLAFPNQEEVQYYTLSNNIQVIDDGFNTPQYRPEYRPDGRINGLGGTLTLQDTNNLAAHNCRLLVIANTGRTTCCKWSTSSNVWLRCDDASKQCNATVNCPAP